MSSAISTRRFGTEISNLPTQSLQKTPKKASNGKPSKSEHATPFNKSQKRRNSVGSSSTITQALKNLALEEELNNSKTLSSSNDSLRYEIEFLLKFQEFCIEPVEGLIPEVLPGYVSPVEVELTTPSKYKSSKTDLSQSHEDNENMENIDPNTKPKSISRFSTPVSQKTALSFTTPKAELPSESNASSPAGASSSDVAATSVEWRIKKIKKQKPKETDAKRLAARQKQIDIGKNTEGYRQFMETVPASERTKSHPRIPDITQVCSKRSWDGQVRKWRRQLHSYDPSGKPMEDEDDSEDKNNKEGASDDEGSSEGDVEVEETSS